MRVNLVRSRWINESYFNLRVNQNKIDTLSYRWMKNTFWKSFGLLFSQLMASDDRRYQNHEEHTVKHQLKSHTFIKMEIIWCMWLTSFSIFRSKNSLEHLSSSKLHEVYFYIERHANGYFNVLKISINLPTKKFVVHDVFQFSVASNRWHQNEVISHLTRTPLVK